MPLGRALLVRRPKPPLPPLQRRRREPVTGRELNSGQATGFPALDSLRPGLALRPRHAPETYASAVLASGTRLAGRIPPSDGPTPSLNSTSSSRDDCLPESSYTGILTLPNGDASPSCPGGRPADALLGWRWVAGSAYSHPGRRATRPVAARNSRGSPRARLHHRRSGHGNHRSRRMAHSGFSDTIHSSSSSRSTSDCSSSPSSSSCRG